MGVHEPVAPEGPRPGSTFPGGKEEGINLLLPGIANFNHQVSGATVFVRID